MATKRQKIAGLSLAAMLAIAVPVVKEWEGAPSPVPHWDKIGKVWDVCYGDTVAEKRTYTLPECDVLLSRKLSEEYGPKVAQCVPGLADRPFQWAGATILSYNIGTGAFCGSTAARRFNAGDWKGGCEAFKLWVKSNGKFVQGLANRRYAATDGRVPEYDLCVMGLT